MLLGIADHLNPHTMKIAKKAIQALIETCAGNSSNQESAFKGQVVDAINQILKYKGSDHGDKVKYYIVFITGHMSACALQTVKLSYVLLSAGVADEVEIFSTRAFGGSVRGNRYYKL